MTDDKVWDHAGSMQQGRKGQDTCHLQSMVDREHPKVKMAKGWTEEPGNKNTRGNSLRWRSQHCPILSSNNTRQPWSVLCWNWGQEAKCGEWRAAEDEGTPEGGLVKDKDLRRACFTLERRLTRCCSQGARPQEGRRLAFHRSQWQEVSPVSVCIGYRPSVGRGRLQTLPKAGESGREACSTSQERRETGLWGVCNYLTGFGEYKQWGQDCDSFSSSSEQPSHKKGTINLAQILLTPPLTLNTKP